MTVDREDFEEDLLTFVAEMGIDLSQIEEVSGAASRYRQTFDPYIELEAHDDSQ